MHRLSDALERAFLSGKEVIPQGRVVSYIPEMARVDPSRLGVVAISSAGREYSVGEVETPFTLQSVAKVISLSLALERFGADAVFERVGMEPTGDPFNSLINVEQAQDRPLNPMINAGAIAVCALLVEKLGDEKSWDAIVELAATLCHPEPVVLDAAVYESERDSGHRNRALAHLLKELGIIRGRAARALDLYLRMCSLRATCRGLARMAFRFAHPGGDRVPLTPAVVRTVNTFMVTCGMYNASGEFAIKAGIPAKSGVSGAIMALVPGKMGLGVIGPALDDRGNSIGGFHLLIALSRELNLSIFANTPLRAASPRYPTKAQVTQLS